MRNHNFEFAVKGLENRLMKTIFGVNPDNDYIQQLQKRLYDNLTNTVIFDIEKESGWIMEDTRSETYVRKQPYPNIFISLTDIYFEQDGEFLLLRGIHSIETEIGQDISLFYETPRKTQKIGYCAIHNGLGETGDERTDRQTDFLCSILDFINSPHIEYEEPSKKSKSVVNYSTKKTKYSSKYVRVYLNKKLKRRTNSTPTGRKNKAHWVKGHFIHYKDKKFYKNIYALSPTQLAEKGYQYDKLNDVIKGYKEKHLRGSGVAQKPKEYKVKIVGGKK